MRLSLALLLLTGSQAFQQPASIANRWTPSPTILSATAADERLSSKQELLALLGGNGGTIDSVLADPITKQPISISFRGALIGGQRDALDISSPTNRYAGSTKTYMNLLEPADKDKQEDVTDNIRKTITKQLTPFLPPPLRTALAMSGVDTTYVPMRDLFTSPSVSYAYERGWRQGFAQAGFPGADREFEMAKEYFAPACSSGDDTVVVDMSCATGLFTRRFAAEDSYDRVLGCDYSDSMLTEARRRIQAEPKLQKLQTTALELVRLDVGQLPMRNDSVDALHAGAAMHCWPDLDAGLSEIYRVLKPGGRYFATTFLSSYFSTLEGIDGDASSSPTQQAFQYFKSVDEMRGLLERNGFENVSIEVLGAACVVIRCEK